MKSTAEIKVSDSLVDQVVGQEKAVELIKKASAQKRNVLLIGEPGTGKSMLAQAMAELLPLESLQDILIYPNPMEENNPKVVTVAAGAGRKIVDDLKKRNFMRQQTPDDARQGIKSFLIIGLLFSLSIALAIYFKIFSDVILAALIIVGGLFTGMLLFASAFATGMKGLKMPGGEKEIGPKLLVDNFEKKMAPFIDATGARAGALLGDVRHDPYQSGGLGTPPHLRVEAGMIHRANRGVLFIDEIATLSAKSQQDLLTAIQEKKYQITGQSEMSSGAMVRTEPVPCDFLLTAAGNMVDLQKMHPALRSRIRGYGYEIYLNDNMDDTPANREKIIRFIAQEVKKDGKIPHFDQSAVDEIIFEARKRAGRKNRLTLKLRDLGGLVRAAGDVAKIKNAKLVTREHVLEAKKLARTLEQQIADKVIDAKKEYEVFKTTGYMSGKVNGLAVIGGSVGFGGILLPIEASVAPSQSPSGKTIATGKLGDIAKEAVQNVFAIIKKYKGQKLSNYDVNIQFLQTYEGVEGDSASVSVATAVLSALEDIPVDQSVAMTGSLSVKGEVMPVGGVSAKIEAAIESGVKMVIIPHDNRDDVVLEPEKAKKIRIVTAQRLTDVLQFALKDSAKKTKLLADIKKVIV